MEVHLVERGPDIGGHARNMGCKATDTCLRCNVCVADEVFRAVRNTPGVHIHTSTELQALQPGSKRIRYKATLRHSGAKKASDATRTVGANAVIVAAGYEPYDPAENSAYNYERLPNVITGIEAEQQLAEQNRITRPSDGSTPARVAFIQCVGSRTEEKFRRPEDTDYCSAVCCAYAMRMGQRLKHQAAESDITVFYMDIQNFGKGFNDFYGECHGKMRFVRSRPYELTPGENGAVCVTYTPEADGGAENGRICKEAFDLVILSVGIRPPAGALALADRLGLPLDEYGFFGLKGASALPDLQQRGIYVAGACEAPRDIAGTIAQAEAVAGAVLRDRNGTTRAETAATGNLVHRTIYRAPREGVDTTDKAVNRDVVVVGGGLAGMQAAESLAALGHAVTLVHNHAKLGGTAAGVPELFGHVAGNGSAEAVGEAIAGLAGRVNSHERIRIIARTALNAVEGELGDFKVTLDGKPPQTLCAGAVVLACGSTMSAVEGSGKLIDMVALVRRMRSGRIPSRVAIVMDKSGEQTAGVSAQVLSAAEQLAARHGAGVTVYCNSIRVAATGMESLYRRAREAGVVITKAAGAPRIAPAGRKVNITTTDPVAGVDVCEAFGLVVRADLCPADNGDRLAKEIPNLRHGPEGVLQADDVWLLPGLTSRPGIFVAGGARGNDEFRDVLADGMAVAGEVHRVLGAGRMAVGDDAAVVDDAKCVQCLTCVRICPHGAVDIDREADAARISVVACQRCGVCTAECPAQAITLPGFTDEEILRKAGRKSRLTVFACENSAVPAAETAGRIPGVRIVPVPCAGKVDPLTVLSALEKGAQKVLVLGCHPGSCQFVQGSSRAQRRAEHVRSALEQAGLDGSRVAFGGIASVEGRRFEEYVGGNGQ